MALQNIRGDAFGRPELPRRTKGTPFTDYSVPCYLYVPVQINMSTLAAAFPPGSLTRFPRARSPQSLIGQFMLHQRAASGSLGGVGPGRKESTKKRKGDRTEQGLRRDLGAGLLTEGDPLGFLVLPYTLPRLLICWRENGASFCLIDPSFSLRCPVGTPRHSFTPPPRAAFLGRSVQGYLTLHMV